MNPSWPSILMSSTLVRVNSSVLRSRPIGLPRYQEKEKCGPVIWPPANHWQPTEFLAVLTNPVTRVCLATSSSLIPPHSGKDGPCLAAPAGPGSVVCGTSGPVEPPEPEQAASSGIIAAAAATSTLALRLALRPPRRPLTPATVAAARIHTRRHAD